MGREEAKISKESFLEVGKNPDFRIFRNNTGMAYQGKKDKRSTRTTLILHDYHPIKYGLQVGSSDYILLKRRMITKEMIGTYIAQFGAVEFKRLKGVASTEQKAFIQMVLKMGGFGGFSRSVEDTLDICGDD